MTTRFHRYELRTTDVRAAHAFYEAVLDQPCTDIAPLPEQARSRGAPAHWLGHLAVDDVEREAAAFVALGAVRLGPTSGSREGGSVAVLRDAGGAVVALSTPVSRPARLDVAWHLLNTHDVERATESYCALFGWQRMAPRELGAHGVQHPFAWAEDGAAVGAFSEIGDRPGVHPHWLFQFRIAALVPALATVRAAGGTVIGPVTLPDGACIAVCEDPQGAAFSLRE